MPPKKLLKDHYPELMKEYDFIANKFVELNTLTYASHKYVNWICIKASCQCVHRWGMTVTDRTRGRGCPYCAHRKLDYHDSLIFLRPDLVEEWDYENNGNKKPENYAIYSNENVNWVCRKAECKCIHKFPMIIADRTYSMKNCPFCAIGTLKIDYHKSIEFLYPHLLQ